MSTSRETVRDALVVLLNAALVGVDLPVKTVVGSLPSTLAGLTPLVIVLGAGTMRERMPIMKPTFFLELRVWVMQAASGWTNIEAEDALDKIESLIADVVADSVNTANWGSLEYTDRSTVVELAVDGTPYYMEIIPITVSTLKA